MAAGNVPLIPKDGELRAVSLQVELDPMPKEDLPVSVIQVLPLNEVQIRDQRENFRVTPLSVLSILSHFGGQSVDLAVDYDHGMWTGENSLAAGWGEKVFAVVPEEWFDRIAPFIEQYGDRVSLLTSEDASLQGVFAFVRWTENAAELIRNREYRYVSPVIFFSYTGEANYLWNAAIVNAPAIDGMDALAASVMPPHGMHKDGAESPSSEIADGDDGTETNSGTMSSQTEERKEGDAEMPNLKQIAQMFGMSVDTEAEEFDSEKFEADLTAEVEALKARAGDAEALAAQVEQVKAELDESSAALAAANEELGAIKEAREQEILEAQTAKISQAIEDGTIAESQREWASENFSAFETLMETLGDTKLGPPQGKVVDESRDPGDLTAPNDRSALRARIKAYADEKGITFTDAYKLLGDE